MAGTDELRTKVEDFAASMLPEDKTAWCKRFSAPKIVHDALWGTFRLEPHEIAVIDTPLVQRLRHVHQTGTAYLTYPSATHSRFEHTLGVLFQATRICSEMRDRPDENRFGPETRSSARMAAILHDTGHGPFSHTSEQYFARFDAMAHATQIEYPNSGAGEVLSYWIIRSPAFRDLLAAINTEFKCQLDAEVIASMVAGMLGADRVYQSEIVHGPFDADKLDYMPRDGMFSGLRLNVDLDRLYTSIDVLSYDGQTRLAGSMSGTSPLAQIMFNKMLLFTSMYHHHKVRAADCMLWALFELAQERKCKLGGRSLECPADFLWLTDDAVLRPELSKSPEIQRLIKAIRARQLWKRALVISRTTTPETMHSTISEEESESILTGFVDLSGTSKANIERRRALAAEMWKQAGKPCAKHEVWLDVPGLPRMREAERMWISVPGNGEPVTLADVLPITQWVQLYGVHKWRAHVFCPADAREAVNRAAKDVLKSEFGLDFNDMATSYAHLDRP